MIGVLNWLSSIETGSETEKRSNRNIPVVNLIKVIFVKKCVGLLYSFNQKSSCIQLLQILAGKTRATENSHFHAVSK